METTDLKIKQLRTIIKTVLKMIAISRKDNLKLSADNASNALFVLGAECERAAIEKIIFELSKEFNIDLTVNHENTI